MFLWFCVANTILIATIVIGYRLSNPEQLPFTWPRIGKGAIVSAGRSAAEAYEHGGQANLGTYLETLEQDTGLRSSLYDSAHRDLGRVARGPEPPLDAWKQPQSALVLDVSGSLGTVRIVTTVDNSYVFVAQIPRRESSGFWSRIFVAAFLVTVALVCYLLAQNITLPIVRLRALTSEFSRGNFSARVTLGRILERKDEIGGLARDFTVMASRIETLMNAQQRLVGDVSHELRSPITRLRLALGLLRRKKGLDPGMSLARMEREVERLDLLIGQLLTLSRLESLNEPPRMETLDLAALVREVSADADFEATSMDRNVQLLECIECRVSGVPDLIRSAIENVVRNALKYTGPNTPVTIRLIRCDGGRTATTVVEDEGPGVPSEMLDHIFEPFYRVDEARNRQTGGAGLGLAIAHRIIRLHGGSIDAANREPSGLDVRIRLPIVTGTEAQEQLPKGRNGDSHRSRR